jgi:hypothetical protein
LPYRKDKKVLKLLNVGFFGFLGTTPSVGTGEELSLDSKVFWVFGILGFVNLIGF